MTPACTVVVIAKEPLPGRVKTRLTPPLDPQDAARLAAAALADTLDVALAVGGARTVLALDGSPGPWLPSGLRVVPQRGAGLDERLGAALADAERLCGGPLVLVGMDTPQLTVPLLADAARALFTHEAVLGPAEDGGFWLLGLRRADPALLQGIPMSTGITGAAQRDRLLAHGLRVATVPPLRDVDVIDDAHAVAAQAPGTRFAAVLAGLRDVRVVEPAR